MANRIVIVVSGGVIQSIHADSPDRLSIEVIDCDDELEGNQKHLKHLGGIDGYIDFSTQYLKPVDF